MAHQIIGHDRFRCWRRSGLSQYTIEPLECERWRYRIVWVLVLSVLLLSLTRARTYALVKIRTPLHYHDTTIDVTCLAVGSRESGEAVARVSVASIRTWGSVHAWTAETSWMSHTQTSPYTCEQWKLVLESQWPGGKLRNRSSRIQVLVSTANCRRSSRLNWCIVPCHRRCVLPSTSQPFTPSAIHHEDSGSGLWLCPSGKYSANANQPIFDRIF